MDHEEKLTLLKSRRFTLASRILSKQASLGVQVKQGTLHEPPSLWKEDSNVIVINSENPSPLGDERRALVYDKAKLYHELAHVKYGKGRKKLAELSLKAHDPKLFMMLANILEDGYIERRLMVEWPGTRPYLKVLQGWFLTLPKDPGCLNGLAFRVRFGKYRFPEEQAKWQQFDQLLDQVVAGDKVLPVWEAALTMTNALTPGPPPAGAVAKSPETCYANGFGEVAPPGLDDDGAETDYLDSEGDGTDIVLNQRGDEGEYLDPPHVGPYGHGHNHDAPTTTSKVEGPSKLDLDDLPADLKASVTQEIESAYSCVLDEVTTELESMRLEEVETGIVQQEFRSGAEAEASLRLADVLRSMEIERSRRRFAPSKHGGLLDPRRLAGLVTDGAFLKREERVIDHSFACVLAVDCSASMQGVMADVTKAARIISGAFESAGIPLTVLTFKGGRYRAAQTDVWPKVPLLAWDCNSATPTDHALALATAKLQDEQAAKKLIIVLTDGSPNQQYATEVAKKVANEAGIYVIGVGLGSVAYKDLEAASNGAVLLQDVFALPPLLEELLIEFTAA